MPLFQKKHGTGNHSLFLPGNPRRVCIRPGDQIECELSDLGNCQDQYEELSPEPRRKKQTPVQRATAKYYEMELEKSALLNPDWKPDGNFYKIPASRHELQELLSGMKAQDLPLANSDLKSAWSEWKYQVSVDAMGERVLLEPTGRYLESIAQAQARKDIVLAEIKEVKSRLENVVEVETSDRDDYRRRHILKGFCRKRDHKIYDVDGYPVEYRDSKPFIPEMDLTLKDYLEKVKAHKARRAAAKRPAKKAPVVAV